MALKRYSTFPKLRDWILTIKCSLISYPGFSLWGRYPSAEMQLAYSVKTEYKSSIFILKSDSMSKYHFRYFLKTEPIGFLFFFREIRSRSSCLIYCFLVNHSFNFGWVIFTHIVIYIFMCSSSLDNNSIFIIIFIVTLKILRWFQYLQLL